MIRFDPASFKDPAGRVFYHGDWVCRTLGVTAQEHLAAAEHSGLIHTLVSEGLLVEGSIVRAHDLGIEDPAAGERVLRQRKVPFVSYSCEWSFEMLRDAALVTLRIMDHALPRGFVLKDANAFNILFDGVVPRLVDTPSIEPYVEGRVWAGYRQFCRAFLFPLLLATYRNVDVQAVLRGTLGEVPADLAASIFGIRDVARPGVLKDVVLQARLERAFGRAAGAVSRETTTHAYPKAMLVSNVRRLQKLVGDLKQPRLQGEWSSYNSECNYSQADRDEKGAFITRFVGRGFDRLVDLGCNTGDYSRVALRSCTHVIALDLDPAAVDRVYRSAGRSEMISPVVANLLNPTPAMGWALRERRGLLERISSDAFLALALIHHLRITGGVPFADIVRELFEIAPEGVIEWIEKTDSQVVEMLALRPDVYDDFAWPTFERILAGCAEIIDVRSTHGGQRRLCHVRARTGKRGNQDMVNASARSLMGDQ